MPPSFHPDEFSSIVSAHVRRYPQMQLQDLYKLVHQASLGSEHAVPDPDEARRRFEKELAHLSDGPEEPLPDPISPDGRILRIHLRPYVTAGLDPGLLLTSFLRTANEFEGSIERFEQYWQIAENLADIGRLPVLPAHLKEYGLRMKGLGHPAVHHSEMYEALYKPAYRVIAREFLPLPLTKLRDNLTAK